MFTTDNFGTPIAKTGKPKPIILSIVKEDEVKPNKKILKPYPIKNDYKNEKPIKSLIPKKCCKHHNPKFCEEEPCCSRCPTISESEESSEESPQSRESDSEYSGVSESDEVTVSNSDESSESSLGESVRNYFKHPWEGAGRKMPKKVKGEAVSEKGRSFQLTGNKKFIPLPNFTERFVEYIAGPSGSGKSTIASILTREFANLNRGVPIYMFSRTEAKNDPAYKGLRIIQIPIDEDLLENPIDLSKEITEKGALIIFDDVATVQNDKLRKAVEALMSDGMEIGRKLDCNMIITNHLVIPNEKKFARTVLNELNMLTVFPKSGSAQQIRYVLKQYWGLDNKQIDAILKIPTRWLRISKNYPQYILWETGARFI
jgi:hypothetical protein